VNCGLLGVADAVEHLDLVVGKAFHSTVLPIRAGAVGRLPAIAEKLNGVIAQTKPSSGRKSTRFHIPGEEIG
jgi:hypothetical protein